MAALDGTMRKASTSAKAVICVRFNILLVGKILLNLSGQDSRVKA
jgi:hypothetical protein